MITDDLQRIGEIDRELAVIRGKYRREAKPLKAERKVLAADVTRQVLEAGKTIQVGNVRAVYQPIVTIEVMKEKEANGND